MFVDKISPVYVGITYNYDLCVTFGHPNYCNVYLSFFLSINSSAVQELSSEPAQEHQADKPST